MQNATRGLENCPPTAAVKGAVLEMGTDVIYVMMVKHFNKSYLPAHGGG